MGLAFWLPLQAGLDISRFAEICARDGRQGRGSWGLSVLGWGAPEICFQLHARRPYASDA